MKLKIITISLLLLSKFSFCQVSKQDIKHFGENLNIRREQRIGVNPYARGFLQVPFDELDIKGVYAVSSKFMSLTYPNQNPILVEGMFTTIEMDKVVFDKFIFQIFKHLENDKRNIIGLLNSFCDNEELAERIYSQYTKEYGVKLSKLSNSNDSNSEISYKNKPFNIPFDDEVENISHDINVRKIELKAIGVQFRQNGENGIDNETTFQINVNSDEIILKSKYLDGNMVEEFVVDTITYENNYVIFALKELSQVKRNSFLSPAKVSYNFFLNYNKQSKSYTCKLISIDKQEQKIFLNRVSLVNILANKNNIDKQEPLEKVENNIKHNSTINDNVFETEEFKIIIEKQQNDSYKFSMWNKNEINSTKPDIVILNGKLLSAGSGGNYKYEFVENNKKYELFINEIGAEEDADADYTIYEDEKEILTQSAKRIK